MNSIFSLNARLLGEETADKFIREHFDITQSVEKDTLRFEGKFKKGGCFGSIMKIDTDGQVSVKKDIMGYVVLQCSNYTYFTAFVAGYAYHQPTEPVVASYE